jgi:uncharacterized hydrophobic protein (TIGR00271 family)
MFHLRAYGLSREMADAGAQLESSGVARHVSVAPAVLDGYSVLTGEVRPESADEVLGFMHDRGVTPDDVALARVEEIGRAARPRGGASLIWADVLGQANVNARAVPRYLVLMIAAGVIAAYGVIEVNSVLIVGAMAVSPDLLPICATCVGLVARRPALARRAFVTLVLGLGIVIVTAAVLSALLSLADLLPEGFEVEQSSLSNLAKTDYSTVLIALAAGVAAMLSFETKASAAVGVAISVTTIPASAYLGVAIGAGGIEHALGAAVVLAINVSLLILSGSLTLLIQRWLPNRSGTPI